VKSSDSVRHRVNQSALIFDVLILNLTFGGKNVKLISIFGCILRKLDIKFDFWGKNKKPRKRSLSVSFWRGSCMPSG
jgi:hypothetical protein